MYSHDQKNLTGSRNVVQARNPNEGNGANRALTYVKENVTYHAVVESPAPAAAATHAHIVFAVASLIL